MSSLESLDGLVTDKTLTAYAELGVSGLKRWGGTVDEEFLPHLRGRKAVQIFKEMSNNDPVVGSLLFAVEQLLRQLTWRVEPASPSWEDQAAALFVEECMHDMSHTWGDMIAETLSMLVYGWSWHEVVYKRRIGSNLRNPMYRSKFSDGRFGWRKIPIRSQETLLEWKFDEDGGIQALVQMAPPDYKRVEIPIEKSLLFRPSAHKNNPEGRSILRNAYRPWYFKKRIEEIEGIGIERDLAGLPVAKIPAEYLHPDAKPEQVAVAEMFKKLVRNVRRDEQEGMVLPVDYFPETTPPAPMFEFELMSSSGARQFDIDKTITRYEQRIAMTVLADFILLGQEKVGSYALSVSKVGIFRTALNSWAHAIADVFNRHELPRLFDLNGWQLDQLPEIVPGEVDPPDLEELGAFITSVSGAGMQLFPDPELENFIRDAAKLPPKSEEAQMLQDMQAAQQQAMQAQQMDAMSMSETGSAPPEEEPFPEGGF